MKVFPATFSFVTLILLFDVLKCISQVPSPRELFRMRSIKISEVKSLKYNLKTTHINGGQDDSIFQATSTTWIETIPDDTVYGAHFHVKQVSDNGISEYYYDGSSAIDVYHQSKAKEFSKTVSVIKPVMLGNGVNSVKTLMTAAMGFNEETIVRDIPHRWLPFIDSMHVADSSGTWMIFWKESYPSDNYFATQQVFFDKNTFIITKMIKRSTWQSIPSALIQILTDIRINHKEDVDSVRNTSSFLGYKTRVVDRNSKASRDTAVSLKGTKVPDLSYISFEGKHIRFRPSKGKLLLLDFWETWCGYCFIAMPKIAQLYKEKHQYGLEIVGVVTQNKEQVRKIIYHQNFAYPTVFADEAALKAFKLQERPRYILVDETGTIVYDGSDLTKIEEHVKERLLTR